MKKRRYRKASFTSGQRKLALRYADWLDAWDRGANISAMEDRAEWMRDYCWLYTPGMFMSSSDLRSLAYDGMTSWYVR